MDLTLTLIPVLATIILMCTGVTDSKNEECISGIKKCYTSFIQDINRQTTGMEICRNVGVFIHCVLDMDCDLTTDQKNLAFDTVEKQLASKGLKCDEISKLKASHVHEDNNDSRRNKKTSYSPSSNNNHNNNNNNNYGQEASHPKFSGELYSETPDFFKTTPKPINKSSGDHLSPGSTVHDHILEPSSSRRSRRLPRPVSWSNWGPQSQSSGKNNPAQESATVSFRLLLLGSAIVLFILKSGL